MNLWAIFEGHFKSRNGKWEMGKWGNGTATHSVLASFPGSSAPEREIEFIRADTFRVPESLGTRLLGVAIFEFGRGFYENTYISVLSTLTLTPTVHLLPTS